jgi:hypothetical protein
MQGFDWIRTELTTKRVAASELVRVTLRYGNVGTIRRMGALLDRAGIPAALLRKLEQGPEALQEPHRLEPSATEAGDRRPALGCRVE